MSGLIRPEARFYDSPEEFEAAESDYRDHLKADLIEAEQKCDEMRLDRGDLKSLIRIVQRDRGERITERNEARQERDELQGSFDLRWKADMRAIDKWHQAGNDELRWPDHADLCVWLMGRITELEADIKQLHGLKDRTEIEGLYTQEIHNLKAEIKRLLLLEECAATALVNKDKRITELEAENRKLLERLLHFATEGINTGEVDKQFLYLEHIKGDITRHLTGEAT